MTDLSGGGGKQISILLDGVCYNHNGVTSFLKDWSVIFIHLGFQRKLFTIYFFTIAAWLFYEYADTWKWECSKRILTHCVLGRGPSGHFFATFFNEWNFPSNWSGNLQLFEIIWHKNFDDLFWIMIYFPKFELFSFEL